MEVELSVNNEPRLRQNQCYVPFLFAQEYKLLLVTILSALMLLYVNLGLPYRVRHIEDRYCYIYWFA